MERGLIGVHGVTVVRHVVQENRRVIEIVPILKQLLAGKNVQKKTPRRSKIANSWLAQVRYTIFSHDYDYIDI
jgi:hypothetical protein